MKRKGKNTYIAVGIALLCLLIFALIDDRDIKVSNIAWSRSADTYRVTFQLENGLDYLVKADVFMLATRNRFIGKGEVFEKAGSDSITLELNPNEIKQVEHHVPATEWGRITFVTVNAVRRK